MTKTLVKNYKSFLKSKNKKSRLVKFFHAFLPEVIFRTTKIEHGNVSRKKILSDIR